MRIVDPSPEPRFWFAIYGSREEQDRLKETFNSTKILIIGSTGNKFWPNRRVIEIPNSPLSIAIEAHHHRFHGDGVWFEPPIYVRRTEGELAPYAGKNTNLVKGTANLDICKYLVAQILLEEGFITEQQCRQFGGEFVPHKPQPVAPSTSGAEANPQAAIVAANATPSQSAPLNRPGQS